MRLLWSVLLVSVVCLASLAGCKTKEPPKSNEPPRPGSEKTIKPPPHISP